MAPASVPRPWLLGLAGLLAAAIALDPKRVDALPAFCPFRRLTGLPCPTCGLTRSWSHAVRGQLTDATALHPFGPPSLVGAVLVLASGRLRAGLVNRIETAPPSLVGLGIAAWLAFWVARLVSARG
jgi:hypothetical protein